MDFIRRPARAAGLVLGLILSAPAFALVAAAVVDRGPVGTARPTVFPLALAVLDPFVRSCARNSVVGSAVVALGSLVLGLGLARVVVGWRFWGRRPLAALALAPLVVPPLFGALGLRILLGRHLDGGAASWLAWAWAELAGGTALVALATAAVLARIEPSWVDAGRLAGASRSQIWRHLAWPIVRPEALRAAAVVFTMTLVEPAGPLVLGLRRTLAFQVVEAAVGTDPLPRAAVLALEGVVLAILGAKLLRWAGGPAGCLPSPVPVARAEAAAWPRATASVLALTAVAALAWLPLSALLAAACSPSRTDPAEPWRVSTAALAGRLAHPQSRQLLANSLALGLAVAALELFLARSLAGPTRLRGLVRRLTTWPDAFPPLAIGVGVLALPWLVRLGLGWMRAGSGGDGGLGRGLATAAGAIDLDGWSPGILLVLAVAASRQASLVRVAERVRPRSEPTLIDAAINLGATRRAARRAASAGWFGLPGGALILTLALAATSLAPPLILAPTMASRPAVPGVLVLADSPGDARPRAAALACCLLAANLSALALAARHRGGVLGEWFRGGL